MELLIHRSHDNLSGSGDPIEYSRQFPFMFRVEALRWIIQHDEAERRALAAASRQAEEDCQGQGVQVALTQDRREVVVVMVSDTVIILAGSCIALDL